MSKTDRSKWSVLDLFFRPSAVLVRVPLEADPAQERLNALGPNVPCPTVRSEQMLKFRLLVEEDMLPVTQAGGCCMPQLIEHRHRLHSKLPAFPDQFSSLLLGKSMGPGQFFQAVIAEHSPKLDHDVGVLAQRRKADQLLNKVQIIFRKHTDMDHTVFNKVIALPAGMAENIFSLMGLQFHQQVKKTASVRQNPFPPRRILFRQRKGHIPDPLPEPGSGAHRS